MGLLEKGFVRNLTGVSWWYHALSHFFILVVIESMKGMLSCDVGLFY